MSTFKPFLPVLLVLGGCIAPMTRTSYIKLKDSAEYGGGPILLKSGMIGDDTTSIWGIRVEDATCLGLEGNLRLGYGFSEHFAVDLTLYGIACEPICREANGDITGFYSMVVGTKLRPWETNDLFTLEIMSGGILNLGWVHGWPAHGEEKYSAWISLGNTSPYVIFDDWSGRELWKHIVPSILGLSVARNYYSVGKRLSPNISFGLLYDWEQGEVDLASIMLGLVWAP